MDSRDEARDFLQTRRARLAPPGGARSTTGGRRRVPGLRREEVAQLAGVSVDYYTRLEKGHLETASYAVLNAVSGALELDAAERSHLHALARAARGESGATHARPAGSPVRPGLTWVLDAMTLCPAYVRDGRLEVVASNALGRTLFEPLFAGEERPNLAVFCFLDPRARDVFTAWHDVARGTVALLRAEVGRHVADEALGALVERLLAGSEVFASLWVEHGVREDFSDIKHLHHPSVGDLVLATETQTSVADPGLTMVAYAAEPGSTSEAALRTLAGTADQGPSDVSGEA